jgi:hypothetical protein
VKEVKAKTANRKNRHANQYSSWDPLTQSKFVYEINLQAGTPVSRAEAYRTAAIAVGQGQSNNNNSLTE